MSEFNVGDWVIGNKLASKYYGITKEGCIAKVINTSDYCKNIFIRKDDEKYFVDPDCFDLYRSEKDMRKDKIVISSDRNDPTKVVAHDFATDLKAEAKCSPDDKFDFNIGAKLAFKRLMEMKEQPWNGWVKCIDSGRGHCHTVGRVYQVKDGALQSDISNNYCPGKKVHCFNDVMDLVAKYDVKFVETEEPKAFTGYVVCISSNSLAYTVGKVYEVTENCITDNSITPFLRIYNGDFIATTAEELNKELERYWDTRKDVKFIEYKGERVKP